MSKTVIFKNFPTIFETYSVGGPKESESFIGQYLDEHLTDDTLHNKSFEMAETNIMFNAIRGVLNKGKVNEKNIDCIFSGDLLDQIIASTFSARNFDISYMGLYNACATFTESLIIASMAIDGGFMKKTICATSSHFSSAERQYRYPLELGSTRPPLSQWTVTGAGAVMLSKDKGIPINSATIGQIVDFGVTDANNMGAAMAPSAVDTVVKHFYNTKTSPSDYDLIVTGDLGTFGSRVFKDLIWEKGFNVENEHVDCGELIYNLNEKEYQGGSGAGCSSMVFASYLFHELKQKKIKRILLISTGALLSAVSSKQGESIPGIAHAVDIGEI